MNHTADTEHGQTIHKVEGAKTEEVALNIAPGKGKRTAWVLGELVIYKISSQRTGGAYALFEVATRTGAGVPPHVQHREDESFYVLEGEYEFLIEGCTSRLGAGSLLYIPKGTLHGHESVGEGVGRMLVSQTPGGLYERFFEEVGKPVNGGKERHAFEDHFDLQRIAAIGVQYGIEIPPPIPQHGRR
jgi:quercetin dioxygenase-like cupin family protein